MSNKYKPLIINIMKEIEQKLIVSYCVIIFQAEKIKNCKKEI